MLYQSYPTNWPLYTPRDKLAQWLQQYALSQDIVVWTSTELQPRPKYDPEKHEWDVTVLRDGDLVKLRPAHIVLATGTVGKPYVPDIPNRSAFKGSVFHSHVFEGPAPYVGKRVVVVGAGNSSIDICQDLALGGAQSVTMIQRSSTLVVGREFVTKYMSESWPEDVPMEISDFCWASMPFGLQKKLSIATSDYVLEAQKELHEKLRKGGLQLNPGEDGAGLYIQTLGRFGGAFSCCGLLVAASVHLSDQSIQASVSLLGDF